MALLNFVWLENSLSYPTALDSLELSIDYEARRKSLVILFVSLFSCFLSPLFDFWTYSQRSTFPLDLVIAWQNQDVHLVRIMNLRGAVIKLSCRILLLVVMNPLWYLTPLPCKHLARTSVPLTGNCVPNWDETSEVYES